MSSKRSTLPWNEVGPPLVHRCRHSATVSSSRAKRPRHGTSDTAYSASDRRGKPAPTVSANRPPESRSSEAITCAACTGRRNAGSSAAVPLRHVAVEPHRPAIPGRPQRRLPDLRDGVPRYVTVEYRDRLARLGVVDLQWPTTEPVVQPRLRSSGWIDVSQRGEEGGQALREPGQVADGVDAGGVAVDPLIHRPVECKPFVRLTLCQWHGYRQRHPSRKYR